MQVKLPPVGTNRYRALYAIYTHGPMTLVGVAKHLSGMNYEATRCALRGCRAFELLIIRGHVYSLDPKVIAHFDDITEEVDEYIPEIVPPRTPREFCQLQSKYLPSLAPRRADAGPVHDVGYINGSAGVNDVFRGCIK